MRQPGRLAPGFAEQQGMHPLNKPPCGPTREKEKGGKQIPAPSLDARKRAHFTGRKRQDGGESREARDQAT